MFVKSAVSIFFLAGTTGLDLVLLIHPRRRPGSPSSYLKVPLRSPVNFSPPGCSSEDQKAKPRGVRSSIVLVPFLVQSRQPNVRHNY